MWFRQQVAIEVTLKKDFAFDRVALLHETGL